MKLDFGSSSLVLLAAAAGTLTTRTTVNAHDVLPESKIFRTLTCNTDADLPNVACLSWKDTFGDNIPTSITVDCGVCYNLDITATDLDITGGINVIGKLVIDKPVNIVTPFVIVQGELHMKSHKPWDGTQDISVTLTNTANQSFMPADSNAGKCGGNPCNVGKKPFVVAGGKLIVDGMPNGDYDTPTWVHLYDVAEAVGGSSGNTVTPVEEYPGVVDDPACSADGVLIDEDFSTRSTSQQAQQAAAAYQIESSLGSHFEYTDDSLKVSQRTDKGHGPVFDLIGNRACLKSGVRYEVNARIKAYRETTGPDTIEDSDCDADGDGCIDIRYEWKNPNGHVGAIYPYHEEHFYGWKYGEEIIISQTIVFEDHMIASDNAYQIFRFIGALPGVAIEVYDFEFKLAKPEAYRTSTDVCSDLALPNGDAELDPMSPFPWKANHYYTNVFVMQDENNLSNHYFRVTGRSSTSSVHAGLRWDTGVGCLETNAVYHINFKYRLHPNDAFPTPQDYGAKLLLRVKRAQDGVSDKWVLLSHCKDATEDAGVWQECDAYYTVTDDIVEEGDRQYEIIFETQQKIDYDLDDISIIPMGGPIDTIIVEDSVSGKWAAGAEVLITSHTNRWDEEQVRTITAISNADEAGYVKLNLNETIKGPTTLKDSELYATEVALLARNIRIQGADDDPNEQHGGHLIVMKTPGDGQYIVGLEVTNMGQAGNLGRYPLHFHLCGDVDGSRLAKNLIKDTNQRCAVVHGTDKLLIDNNVAYNTFGHCFMVEDGFEKFNMFKNNLGARTKRAITVIPKMADKNNGDETDGDAATFWITNPTNYIENNVAAGGMVSGFWYELRSRPRGTMASHFNNNEWNLRSMDLGSFKNNVAHSYASPGIRTYPHGYVPNNKGIFENSRVYRNDDSGIFLHNSRNITIKNFHIADNEQGVDLDRIDLFEMHDSEIVGRSQDYKFKMESQKARDVCGGNPRYSRGVEMHTFVHDRRLESAVQGYFQNVTFSGFDDTGCEKTAVFVADDEVRLGRWDYWTILDDIKVDGVSDGQVANFCRATVRGITDNYIIDSNSAFGDGSGPATIMTYLDNGVNKMQTFVDPIHCTDYADNCYSYCENTCLRTVTYRVDPATTENVRLKVCRSSDNKCEYYEGEFRHWDERFRLYSPALPAGDYTAEFLDIQNQVIWPRGVNVTYESDMCNGSGIQEGDVVLTEPNATAAQCNELISNGGADSGTDGWSFERNMGIEIVPLQGIGGGNAFGDARTESHDDGLTQHIDTRCLSLRAGAKYEVQAFVKLVDGNGSPVYCDPSVGGNDKCPRIILWWGNYRLEGEWFTRDREIISGVTRARAVNDNGYQLVSGIVTIDERLATASNVAFFVERRIHNQEMLVDNISMTYIPLSTCESGTELVFNGNFEDGTSETWDDRDAEAMKIVSPGAGNTGHALEMKTGSALTSLKNECIIAGRKYVAQAKFRLLDWNKNPVVCNPMTGNPRCPSMDLRAYDSTDYYNRNQIAYIDLMASALDTTVDTGDGYTTMWGVFEATTEMENAADVQIYFRDTNGYASTIIDDVSIMEVAQPAVGSKSVGSSSSSSVCNELIANGDNEMGVAQFWERYGTHSAENVFATPGSGGSGVAARVTNRDSDWKGMWWSGQKWASLSTCLTPNSQWEISALIRLLKPGTNEGETCDPSISEDVQERCPRIRVQFYGADDRWTPTREEIIYNYPNGYDATTWNEFRAIVHIPPQNNISKMMIIVRDPRAHVDIAVDNLSMVPVQ